MSTASNLTRLRRERGMTLSELAELSGVPRGTCSTWEYEGVPDSVPGAVRIADALGVEVRDLYGEGPAG